VYENGTQPSTKREHIDPKLVDNEKIEKMGTGK
jgi:hypothetical protein